MAVSWQFVAGRFYQTIYDIEKAKKYYEEASEEAKDHQLKVEALCRLGELHLIPSTPKDDLRAIETFNHSLDILQKCHDPFMEADIKTSLSNALRRRKRFDLAEKYAEEAKNLFETKVLKSAKGEEEEEKYLAYAGCLNILGLIYYGKKSNLEDGLCLCKQGEKIKREFGDVRGIAESKNAIGLIFITQAKLLSEYEEKVKKLGEAIKCFEEALSIRIAIGDFRGSFQHYRNLGLAHGEMAKLSEDPQKGKEYFEKAIKDFNEALSYLRMVKGIEPIGEILECKFRLGEIYKELGENEKAIELSSEVETERKKQKDWHNRVRALDNLRKVEKEPKKRDYNREILSIYEDVLVNDSKLQEMRDDPDKSRNAEGILKTTSKYFEEVGLSSEAEKVNKVSRELREKLSQGTRIETELEELIKSLTGTSSIGHNSPQAEGEV